MKAGSKRFILGICLVLFFAMSIFMTIQSQINYKNACIEVVTLQSFSAEALTITKSCYVENTINEKGELTFNWKDYSVKDILNVGSQVRVDIGSKLIFAEVVEISDVEKGILLTIRLDAFLGDIYSEHIDGFIVSVDVEGPYRTKVVPASCIRDINGIPMLAVVYSRSKMWGTEYYIHYEVAQIYERTSTKCALKEEPAGGELVVQSEGALQEGTKVIWVNEIE